MDTKTYICPDCGAPFETSQKYATHRRLKQCKPPEPVKPTTADAIGDAIYPAEIEPEPEQASLPLSICPADINILPQGRTVYLRVEGRSDGEKFLVDDVKMWGGR